MGGWTHNSESAHARGLSPLLQRVGYGYVRQPVWTPRGMRKNSVSGYSYRFWAILLPTVGVQVVPAEQSRQIVFSISLSMISSQPPWNPYVIW